MKRVDFGDSPYKKEDEPCVREAANAILSVLRKWELKKIISKEKRSWHHSNRVHGLT